MQQQRFGLAGLGVVVVAACATAGIDDEKGEAAGSVASAPALPAPEPKKPYRPGEMAVGGLGNEPDSEVGVELERGFLNQGDVNAVLEKHTPDLIACYQRAGAAQRYAAGEVTLRFLVSPAGEVTDVLVVGNQLGSYPVERCLVVEGRKIPFPKPGGDRAADFDYSIEFRSTHPHTVVDLDPSKLGRRLTAKVPLLGRCGRASSGALAAVAYVRPGGQVVSVGLSSDKPIDTMVAKCVVDRIQTWRLPVPGGHLVRTSFPVSRGEPTATGETAGPIGPTARLRRARMRTSDAR